MKHQYKLSTILLFFVAAITISSCKKDIDPIREGIERSELTFTEVSGAGVEAHGDHFHGLAAAVDGEKHVLKFNNKGFATENGHLHLEADAIYRLELKAWDYNGVEVQNTWLVNQATADNYKAFLIGGNFILNPKTTDESGAIFQPRELTYGDGTTVTGTGGIGTTGVISYFTAGHSNEGPTKQVSYVIRKLNAGVKATVTRADWNRADYATAFGGSDVLKLNFEIHAEEGHNH